MYLRLRHPLDAAGQLEESTAPADSGAVCASTLNFPNAFCEVATSHLSRAGKTKIVETRYTTELLKLNSYISLHKCQRTQPDTMMGEWEFCQ